MNAMHDITREVDGFEKLCCQKKEQCLGPPARLAPPVCPSPKRLRSLYTAVQSTTETPQPPIATVASCTVGIHFSNQQQQWL
jgi:hypothetical protein